MAPAAVPRLRILSVGGNAVSAFLSWRLQATNACDVTLVWKSGFDAVSQYGISFRSKQFGNERFKPHEVVRTPEEASGKGAFDYVLLCVKALPDVYDLASVIESVVTPQHTCILVNTTHTLGVESHVEQRFPTNVVLSLVSGADLTQLGPAEFEHVGATDVWVGPANKNPSIPASIQSDMAEALAMTLNSGQVDCKVSDNIRQQQYERMIGPIAFHPCSVIFETSSHTVLMEKIGVRDMILGVIDELLSVAKAQGCTYPADFKDKTVASMLKADSNSIMYQDFLAKRPMEVETYLGSPIKLSKQVGISVPRIETLYSVLHHLNIANQTKITTSTPTMAAPPTPRLVNGAYPRPPMNGANGINGFNGNGKARAPSGMGMPPPGVPPGMRRGPPPMNGYGPRPIGPNGFPLRGPSSQQPRRNSDEADDLGEFSHLVLYDNPADGGPVDGSYEAGPSSSELALRERELMLRQRELALREQEFQVRRGGRRPPPTPSHRGEFDDDDDDEYFDPMAAPQGPPIDPDNFDMMSVTSRRTRKAPSASQLRKNPENGGMSMRSSQQFMRQGFGGRNRSSKMIAQNTMGLHESLMDNPMMGYSSNRYGEVDRKARNDESRTNSLTAARLEELHGGPGAIGGPYPSPMNRRTSQSPGNPFPNGGPVGRPNGRPSPPNGYMPPNGRPSPPGDMRQPVPRYPNGHGVRGAVSQQVEQHAGVSNLHPPKGPQNVRSLTGSASASAESGDSGASANIDSENSAHSSRSSLGHAHQAHPAHPIGVR